MNLMEDFKDVVRQGFSLLANITTFAAEKVGEALKIYFGLVKKWSIRLLVAAAAPLIVVVPCLMLGMSFGWLYGAYSVYLALLIAMGLVMITPMFLVWRRAKPLFPNIAGDLEEWMRFIKKVLYIGVTIAIIAILFSAFSQQLGQLKWFTGRALTKALQTPIKQQEVTAQWGTLTWFDNVGQPLLWYSRSSEKGYRLWTAPGFDPDTGEKLQAVRDEITRNKIIADFVERERIQKEREEKEKADAARRSEEQRLQMQKEAAHKLLVELRAMAKSGDAEAQFDLAQRYAEGEGVEKDDAEALKWYRRAAEQEILRAQNTLANIYKGGRGVPQDYAEAVKWYRKAAEQDSASAQINLATLYAKGQGVAKDEAEAYKWLLLAKEPGEKPKKKAAKKAPKRAVVELEAAMTPDQLAEGKRRADEWSKQQPAHDADGTIPFFDGRKLRPIWFLITNGCRFDKADDALRISGVSAKGDWKGNGIHTRAVFPRGSFTACVDFKVPRFVGGETCLVYFHAKGSRSENVAMAFSMRMGYRIQTWSPAANTVSRPRLGDENRVFHRMKLVYDDTRPRLKAYVDDQPVGEVPTYIDGRISFGMTCATESSGAQIDLYFKQFSYTKTSQ